MRWREGNANTENKWSRNGEKKMKAFHQMLQGLLHLLSKGHFIFSFSGPYIPHCTHNKCKIRVLWKSLWINICLNHNCAQLKSMILIMRPRLPWGEVGKSIGIEGELTTVIQHSAVVYWAPSRRQILGWILKAEKVPRRELGRSACQMDEDISILIRTEAGETWSRGRLMNLSKDLDSMPSAMEIHRRVFNRGITRDLCLFKDHILEEEPRRLLYMG